MGGDAGSMFGNIAGRVLGVLSALPSRGGGFGNLANYMAARQRAMSDPNARAALTPFGAGFYQIGGGMEREPGTYQPVAAPADFMGPTIPTATGPADVRYVPGAEVWRPHLQPLAPEAALQEEASRRTLVNLQSPDIVTRARAKQDAKIPLTPEETNALVAGSSEFMKNAPPGSSVSIGPGGVTYTLGSQYPQGVYQTPGGATLPGHLPPVQAPGGGFTPGGQLAQGEYATEPEAAAVRQPGEQTVPTGRGSYHNVKVEQKPITLPPLPAPAPPAPAPAAPVQPAAPAPVVQAAPPPPPSPPPKPAAPPPPITPAPSWDPNQVVPHVIVPEPPPPTVAYPSPAFATTPEVNVAAAIPPPPEPAPTVTPTTPPPPAAPPTVTPAAPPPPPAETTVPVYPAQGFVFHHSGGSTLEGLRNTLQKRGLGSQYLMDRDGTIYSFAGAGSPHIRPNDQFGGIAPGLSNKNAVGMEVVAKNDQDITPEQVASARRFIAANYPNVPVYGHGQVNPGHKMADEGLTIVRAIQGDRGAEPGTPVPRRAPNTVDLAAPFFRQVEASRGLPAGVLSAMADKESSGNPLAESPVSTARGLFGITKDTARAWGISANDRLDPVKSTIAAADTLAARAQDVGIERAIGMHYGGPGAAYNKVVGASGLSPAQYSRDVLRRAQKYAGAPPSAEGLVAFPSPAFAAEAPPAPAAAPPGQVPVLRLPKPAAPVAPPLPAPVRGPGGTTLKTTTETSQAGESRTYEAPEDLAAKQRQAIMEADVQRLRKGQSETQQKLLGDLYYYRDALNAFEEQYPDPRQWEPHVGAGTGLWQDFLAYTTGSDPAYRAFKQALAPFPKEAFKTTGASMSAGEAALVLPNIPTGNEPDIATLQTKLKAYREGLDTVIAFRLATQNLPSEAITDELFNSFLQQRTAQRRAAREAEARTTEGPPATIVVRPPTPTTTTAPPPPAPPAWQPTWVR